MHTCTIQCKETNNYYKSLNQSLEYTTKEDEARDFQNVYDAAEFCALLQFYTGKEHTVLCY